MGKWRGPAALACLLLLGWSTERFFSLAVMVCLCRIGKVKDLKTVFYVTMALFFLKSFPSWGIRMASPPTLGNILSYQYGDHTLDDLTVKTATLVIRLLLAYGLYWLLNRLTSSGWRLVVLHATLLASIFAASALLDLAPTSASLVMSLLLALCGFFYRFCYLLLETPDLKVGKFMVLYVSPFWDSILWSRPVLDIHPQEDKRDLLDQRCISLCLWGSALMLGGSLLQAFLHSETFHGYPLPLSITPLPRLESTGFAPSLFLVYGRWQVFLALFWSSLYRISNFFSMGLFMECCWLIMSYDVPRRFSVPFRANSFADFYNALIPYYVMVITRVYLYPLYFSLRRLGWSRVFAYDTALAFAVIVGGMFTHILRDVHLVAMLGAYDFVLRYVVFSGPYFILIFVAVRWVRFPKVLARILPAPVKFTILVTLYSLIFLTRTGGLFIDWTERFHFAKALFLGI